MKNKTIGCIVFVTLLLLACGGADDLVTESASSNGVPDACTLLSEADFTALSPNMGSLQATGEVAEDGLFTTCSWENSDTTQFVALNIWGSDGPVGGLTEDLLEAQRAGQDEGLAVDSFGTDTILAGNQTAWTLSWRSGNSLVILFTAIGTDIDEAGMISLGEKIDAGLN